MNNLHAVLCKLIEDLDEGQKDQPFSECLIAVYPENIICWWEDVDDLLLDVDVLSAAAAKYNMKPKVMKFGEAIAVQLWPIEKDEGGAD